MRVLFYCHELAGGGAEIALCRIANLVAERGFEVVFISRRFDGHIASILSKSIRRIETGSSRTIFDTMPLVRIVSGEAPDCIVTTLFRCNLVMSLSTLLAAWKGRLVLRETTPLSYRVKGKVRCALYSVAYSFMSRMATVVIAPTEAVRRSLLGFSRRYFEKTLVAPNVVARSSSVADRLGPKDVPHIVSVGRLEPVKGYDLLFDAIRICDRRSLRISVCGQGSMKSKLVELAKGIGHASFDFLGFVPEPSSVLRDADVFVSTSHFEGFPNALVEAACLGIPVVAVDDKQLLVGLREMLGLSERCFVESRDPTLLALRIEEALRVPSFYKAREGAVLNFMQRSQDDVLAAYLGIGLKNDTR